MRRVSWNLASCHATVQKLLVRQVLNKSKSRSWSATVGQCVINMCNHDAIESLSLFYRCHKQNTPRTSCGYHLYTDYLLWRNFLSPQCRNCSRDPDPEWTLTHHKTKTSHGRPVYKFFCTRLFFIGRLGLAMINLCVKFKVPACSRYEDMNGGANVGYNLG